MCSGTINEIYVHTSAFKMHFSSLYSAEAVLTLHIMILQQLQQLCICKNTSSDYVFFTVDVRQALQRCVSILFYWAYKIEYSVTVCLMAKGCREKVESEGLYEAH